MSSMTRNLAPLSPLLRQHLSPGMSKSNKLLQENSPVHILQQYSKPTPQFRAIIRSAAWNSRHSRNSQHTKVIGLSAIRFYCVSQLSLSSFSALLYSIAPP